MKLFFVIFLITNLAYSQAEIRNLSLKTPESRILYRGGDNFLVIEKADLDSTAILISTTDTLHVYKNDSRFAFYYRLGTKKSADTLQLVFQNKVLDSFIFEVRNLNDYKIYLGELTDTFVTVKQLLNSFPLVASHKPELYLDNYNVFDFSARIIKRNADAIQLTMHSTRRFKNGYDDIYNDSLLDVYVQNRTKIELRLSKGMRPKRMDQPLYVQHISRMRRGEVIIFDNATVAGASGILRLIRINKQFTVM